MGFFGAGAILGGLGAIGKFGMGLHQNHLASKIHPVWQQYQTSPYAQQQLGLAQGLFNARMAGAPEMERNIYSNAANFNSNVGRNASDSSTALSLMAAGQGQADNTFSNLQTQELQNKYGMLANLNNAYGAMTDESGKVYNSMLQKYGMDVNEKNALRGAGMQNINGAISDLSGGAMQYGQYQQNKQFNDQYLQLLKGK